MTMLLRVLTVLVLFVARGVESSTKPYFCCVLPTHEQAAKDDEYGYLLPTAKEKASYGCPKDKDLEKFCLAYFNPEKPMLRSDGLPVIDKEHKIINELSYAKAKKIYEEMVTERNKKSAKERYQEMQKDMHYIGERLEMERQIQEASKIRDPKALEALLPKVKVQPGYSLLVDRAGLKREIEAEEALLDKAKKDPKTPKDAKFDTTWLSHATNLLKELDKLIDAEVKIGLEKNSNSPLKTVQDVINKSPAELANKPIEPAKHTEILVVNPVKVQVNPIITQSLVKPQQQFPQKIQAGGFHQNNVAIGRQTVPVLVENESQAKEQQLMEQTHQEHQHQKASIRRRLKQLLASRVNVDESTSADATLELEVDAVTPYRANYQWPRGMFYYRFGSGANPDCPNIYTPALGATKTALELANYVTQLRAQYALAFLEYERHTGITFLEYQAGQDAAAPSTAHSVFFCIGHRNAGSYSSGGPGKNPALTMKIHIGEPARTHTNTYIHELGHALSLRHTNQAQADDPTWIHYNQNACVEQFVGDRANCPDGHLPSYDTACGVTAGGAYTHQQARNAIAGLPGAGRGYVHTNPWYEGMGADMSANQRRQCARYLCAWEWQSQYTPLYDAPLHPNTQRPTAAYDYYSIMHYPLDDCLKDNRDFITRLGNPVDSGRVGNSGLTVPDRFGLRALYHTAMTGGNPTQVSITWDGVTITITYTTNWLISDIKNVAAKRFGVGFDMVQAIVLRDTAGQNVFPNINPVTTAVNGVTIGTGAGLNLEFFQIALKPEVANGPAKGGNAITIIGHPFLAPQGTGTVTIGVPGGNTAPCAVTAWAAAKITCTVPAAVAGATFGPAGNTQITVTNSAGRTGVAPYRYDAIAAPPAITTVNPTTQDAGKDVTLTGTDFWPYQGGVTVAGVAAAAIKSWTDTQIVITVPVIPLSTVINNGNYPIIVTSVHNQASPPKAFKSGAAVSGGSIRKLDDVVKPATKPLPVGKSKEV